MIISFTHLIRVYFAFFMNKLIRIMLSCLSVGILPLKVLFCDEMFDKVFLNVG